MDADQATGFPLNRRECLHQRGLPCLDCGLCEGGMIPSGHTFVRDPSGPGQHDRCRVCFRPVGNLDDAPRLRDCPETDCPGVEYDPCQHMAHSDFMLCPSAVGCKRGACGKQEKPILTACVFCGKPNPHRCKNQVAKDPEASL